MMDKMSYTIRPVAEENSITTVEPNALRAAVGGMIALT
jgi:hypothetical protein